MKLLPCPFCGSNADLIDCDNGYFCFCKECRSQSNNYPTYEEATEKWNTRHSPWISVTDKLYPIDEEILITDGDDIYVTSIDEDVSAIINGYYVDVKEFGITHWMPLPQPPKETE